MTEMTLKAGPFISPLTRPAGQLYRMVLLAALMQSWNVSLQNGKMQKLLEINLLATTDQFI